MDEWHETSVLFLMLFDMMIIANVDECRDTLVVEERIVKYKQIFFTCSQVNILRTN